MIDQLQLLILLNIKYNGQFIIVNFFSNFEIKKIHYNTTRCGKNNEKPKMVFQEKIIKNKLKI